MKSHVIHVAACVLYCTLAPGLVNGQGPDSKTKDPPPIGSVTLLLAEAQRTKGAPAMGLRHHYQQADGRTTVLTVEGQPCRCLDATAQGHAKGYLYFSIDPAFKTNDLTQVRIDVDYFDGLDGQLGVFGLQYDATALGENLTSKQLHPSVPLRGSKKWLKATFHVKDATFRNAQNGGSDFRLWASPPEICVSRVTVTLEPQGPSGPAPNPMAFDADGKAKLREWNVQWDAGEQPAFASPSGGVDGARWLEIRAPGMFTVGSWRTAVLLDPGAYEFTGRVRTEGVADGDGSGGITLRASGRGAARRVSAAPDGTALSYAFTMSGRDYVELVCEFAGENGSARFDLDSLKLIQKSPTPK